MPRLEQWHFGADQWTGGFVPPSEERKFLHGAILNDTERGKFHDGDHVFTSLLKNIDLVNKTAQTLNTLYELGEPLPAYVKWCTERGINLSPVVQENGSIRVPLNEDSFVLRLASAENSTDVSAGSPAPMPISVSIGTE